MAAQVQQAGLDIPTRNDLARKGAVGRRFAVVSLPSNLALSAAAADPTVVHETSSIDEELREKFTQLGRYSAQPSLTLSSCADACLDRRPPLIPSIARSA